MSFLDFMAAKHRDVVAVAKADAARLASLGIGPGFPNLDAVPTSFSALAARHLDDIISDYARLHKLDRDTAKAFLRRQQEPLAAEMRDLARRYQVMLSFALGGRRIFRVTEGLATRLLETRIDAPGAALQSPFESIVLLFDDKATVGAFNYGRPFRSTSVRGTISAFISEVRDGNARKLTATSFHTRGHDRHGTYSRSFDCQRSTVEQMLDCAWETESSERQSNHHGREFHRLLLNALLYIGSRGARLRSVANGQQRRSANAGSTGHVVVGEGLSPLSTGCGRSQHASLSDSGARFLRRELVIGHWRLHAIGRGRNERKLIWIEPYWRGPELAQAVSRPRLVR